MGRPEGSPILTHSGQDAEDSFCIDPYADPEQEKLLWRQRSKNHEGSGKPLETPGRKWRKALFRGQRKPGRTFVISRSPVQVRPVAPASEIPPHGSEKAVAQKAAAFSSTVLRVSSFSPCNPLRWACMGSPFVRVSFETRKLLLSNGLENG